jgi:hypothetical protein
MGQEEGNDVRMGSKGGREEVGRKRMGRWSGDEYCTYGKNRGNDDVYYRK